MTESPHIKRIKQEVDENVRETLTFIPIAGQLYDTNEIIDIIFIDVNAEKKFNKSLPIYTHQLFESETIQLIVPSSNTKITVFVDCISLLHYVQFSKNFSDDEKNDCMNKLTNALPENTIQIDSIQNLNVNLKPDEVVGKLFKSFEQDGQQFEIRLASHRTDHATNLLQKAEKIAMWFIETADSIDFNDDRWEVLLLYHRSSHQSTASFIGYMTLFTFLNPFTGSKLRICQALIFPHLQGKGLGYQLLRTVYELAKDRETIVEVNVEDPAPAFEHLQDYTDFRWFIDQCVDIHSYLQQEFNNVEHLAKKLKLTDHQIIFIMESFELIKILKSIMDIKLENWGKIDDIPWETIQEESLLKQFRLKVKRRLLSSHPELKLMEKSEMQEELINLFEIENKRYLTSIKIFHDIIS